MNTPQEIKQFKSELKDEILKELAASIGQVFADTRNSFSSMQERIEGKNEIFLTDMNNIVEKRLDAFNARIAKVEHWIWSAIIGLVILFILNIVLLTKEISLARKETLIESTLKEIKQELKQITDK